MASDQESEDMTLSEEDPAQFSFDKSEKNESASKHRSESRYSTEETREASLRAELENIRKINTVIEDVISSLEKTRDNMGTVSGTVNNASTLLDTWTRILSQTEHNQRLILKPQWQGASQDLIEIENEAIMKQQAAERRELEESQRREAAARKAEEEERRRAQGASTPSSRGTRGARGRVRAAGRAGPGAATGSSGYVGVGGQGGRGARAGYGQGRSTGTTGRVTRGTGRGRGIG